MIYSTTSRASFGRVDDFRQEILNLKPKNSQPVFLLVGNHCDRFHEREVSRQEGEDKAKAFGCLFVEVSTKMGESIDGAFTELVRALRRRHGIR